MTDLNSIWCSIQKHKFKSTIIGLFTILILISLVKQIQKQETNKVDNSLHNKASDGFLNFVLGTGKMFVRWGDNRMSLCLFDENAVEKWNVFENLAKKYIHYRRNKCSYSDQNIINELNEDSINLTKTFRRNFTRNNLKIVGLTLSQEPKGLEIWVVFLPLRVSPSAFIIHEFPGYNKNNTLKNEYNIPVKIGTLTDIRNKKPQHQFIKNIKKRFARQSYENSTFGMYTVDLFEETDFSVIRRYDKDNKITMIAFVKMLLSEENYKKIKDYYINAYYTDENAYIILEDGIKINNNFDILETEEKSRISPKSDEYLNAIPLRDIERDQYDNYV